MTMEFKKMVNPQAGPGNSGESRPSEKSDGCRTEYGGGKIPFNVTSHEDSSTDESTSAVKRKRGDIADESGCSELDSTSQPETHKPKRVPLRTPTKHAQEALTIIEAKVGEQLANCMTNVKNILNKSFEEMERRRSADKSPLESVSEDFLSPLGNWDVQQAGPSVTVSTKGSDTQSQKYGKENLAKQNLFDKMRQAICTDKKGKSNHPATRGGTQRTRGEHTASETERDQHDMDAARASEGGKIVSECMASIDEKIKIVSAATSKWKEGKLAFNTEQLAQCAEGLTSIQRNLLVIQREHSFLLAQYQLQLAENRNLNTRLDMVEARLDRSENMREEWADCGTR